VKKQSPKSIAKLQPSYLSDLSEEMETKIAKMVVSDMFESAINVHVAMAEKLIRLKSNLESSSPSLLRQFARAKIDVDLSFPRLSDAIAAVKFDSLDDFLDLCIKGEAVAPAEMEQAYRRMMEKRVMNKRSRTYDEIGADEFRNGADEPDREAIEKGIELFAKAQRPVYHSIKQR